MVFGTVSEQDDPKQMTFLRTRTVRCGWRYGACRREANLPSLEFSCCQSSVQTQLQKQLHAEGLLRVLIQIDLGCSLD